MRFIAILGLAAAANAIAQPHGIHKQFHYPKGKRDMVTVAGPTVVVYELDGRVISEVEVQEGIRNGTLVFATNGALSSAMPSTSVVSINSSPISASETVQAIASYSPVVTEQTASVVLAPLKEPSSSRAAPLPSETPPDSADSSSSSGPLTKSISPNLDGVGIDREFPDGELDCSHFPSDYGAIYVGWLSLGGWTGIQKPNEVTAAGLFDDIMTMTKDQCSDGGCCVEGSYCSYACPPGYQKSQWPINQGATGQSIGGLLCKDGKLYLTNPGLSRSICMSGSHHVKVSVRNTLDTSVAVCRTDYPGTESETVPLDALPGTTSSLTCPDAENYYKWQGGSTSAQYYVNPKGISIEKACQWGSPANPWGNYAPMNLGVGYSAGSAWLSIFQNSPTTNVKLDFDVEIVGDNGGYDNLGGRCRYQSGRYCSGEDYQNCDEEGNGCTVRYFPSYIWGRASLTFLGRRQTRLGNLCLLVTWTLCLCPSARRPCTSRPYTTSS